MSSSIAIHFQLVICSHIGTYANDCGKLKDTKDTPDVSFKTGWMKGMKQTLPIKEFKLSCATLDTAYGSSLDMNPSVWEAPWD